MMEDDWFLPDIVGQPLQNVSEYHMEKAKKYAQQPSNGPQKKWIGLIRPIFSRKNCKELFTFVSAIVKRHAGKCTMQVFTFSWWDCSIANQHFFITVYRNLSRHGEASCYRDYSTHFKTIINKANDFQVCC